MLGTDTFPHHAPHFMSEHIRTERDIEYDAFSRVSNALQNARSDSAALIPAIHMNTELWTLMANDLASPGNELPDQLKARLLSLAIFSIRHGYRALAGDASVSVLIDINRSIMAGLRSNGGA